MLMKPPVRRTRTTHEILDRNAGEMVKIHKLAEVDEGPITAASVEGVNLEVKDGVADVPPQYVPRLLKEGWKVVRPTEKDAKPAQTGGPDGKTGNGANTGESTGGANTGGAGAPNAGASGGGNQGGNRGGQSGSGARNR